MMWKTTELKYEPDPVLERAMDVLLILHADHEQNCSTTTMRAIGSSDADPYSAAAGATAALYGPKHGGANEAVLRMLEEIGSVDQVPEYVERAKKGEFRLMGFGHRVYKNYDPRAKVIRKLAHEVFEVTGKNALLDIAVELETHRARGRVLRRAQALPERRLLLGDHLPGDGLPDVDVPGAVRDGPHPGLARALGGEPARRGAGHRPPRASCTSAPTSATTSQVDARG